MDKAVLIGVFKLWIKWLHRVVTHVEFMQLRYIEVHSFHSVRQVDDHRDPVL
jgi:hypothetical protein